MEWWEVILIAFGSDLVGIGIVTSAVHICYLIKRRLINKKYSGSEEQGGDQP